MIIYWMVLKFCPTEILFFVADEDRLPNLTRLDLDNFGQDFCLFSDPILREVIYRNVYTFH